MYLVNEKDLKGLPEAEIKSRKDIVDYLTEWSDEVYRGAKDKKTISLAGRYIRSRVLEKGETFVKLLDAVVLVDLSDFWKAVDGYNGKRDDVMLYGVFCMVFGEVNAEMKEESKKLEGNIGYAPKLRYDISGRVEGDVGSKKKDPSGVEEEPTVKGKKKGKKKTKTAVKPKNKGQDVGEDSLEQVEEHKLEEEARVEIKDKYVTPTNVNKLTIGAVGVIMFLVVVLAWMIIF